jgi:DNA-binding transcriptional regulator LsrR (DeoR family)
MPAPRDRAALIKAARMYFLDGRSQDDVARALGTSRSNVSRMLTAARAQGMSGSSSHTRGLQRSDPGWTR